MLPFIFWIASYIKKHRADITQRILTHLGPFHVCFGQNRRQGKRAGGTLRSTEKTQRHRGRNSNKNCTSQRRYQKQLLIHSQTKELSTKCIQVIFQQHAFGCKFTEFCSLSLPKNKADWRGRKTFRMLNNIKILCA